ncbi:MAG: class I SAM-dependent methyltransferase [Rhodospirillales bacterium]|nr:class I SAM-dependent methyltransferase [Rhodospirillales bacterium]
MDILRRTSKYLAPVAEAYDQRLAKYGTQSQGVFWKSEEGQFQRFEILLGVVQPKDLGGPLSVNDFGCGYGAFFEFLRNHSAMIGGSYTGYDISAAMVRTAKRRTKDRRADFIRSPVATRPADYSFVSGTFNLKLGCGERDWNAYVKASLENLWTKSRKGLAFNMLKADGKGRQGGLYYANANDFFDFCSRTLSANVELKEDYPLSEWTLWIRR